MRDHSRVTEAKAREPRPRAAAQLPRQAGAVLSWDRGDRTVCLCRGPFPPLSGCRTQHWACHLAQVPGRRGLSSGVLPGAQRQRGGPASPAGGALPPAFTSTPGLPHTPWALNLLTANRRPPDLRGSAKKQVPAPLWLRLGDCSAPHGHSGPQAPFSPGSTPPRRPPCHPLHPVGKWREGGSRRMLGVVLDGGDPLLPPPPGRQFGAQPVLLCESSDVRVQEGRGASCTPRAAPGSLLCREEGGRDSGLPPRSLAKVTRLTAGQPGNRTRALAVSSDLPGG